jgi:hypothetical protein
VAILNEEMELPAGRRRWALTLRWDDGIVVDVSNTAAPNWDIRREGRA